MEQPKKKLHPAVATIIVIVLVGIITSAIIIVQNANNSDDTKQTPSSSETMGRSNQTDTTTQSTDTSSYEDGTYSAEGRYATPGGIESIQLTVTIQDGVIESTELAQNAKDSEAKEHQAEFAENYETLVVGKNVDEVSLSRVAGSSLTSDGFNRALEQIKEDAQA